MKPLRRSSHFGPLRPLRRQTTSSCTIYTSPLSTSTLPVFTPLTLTWDPSCLSLSTSTIDLYLEVINNQSTSTPVHEWTGIVYSSGKLETTFNPSWWNASTGAGEVNAQLLIVATGSEIWETSAPVGPQFLITYNGSYPSVTSSGNLPAYTGPSVESVAAPSTSTISGGKLAAAVAIPLLVIVGLLAAYVGWNKWKKREVKKRWSAVIDQRMSMISQGTWAAPGSRPSSHFSQRPGSQYSTTAPRSPLAPPGSPRAQGTHRPSPSSSSSFHSPSRHHHAPSLAPSLLSLSTTSTPSPPSPSKGPFDRSSKISFGTDVRPSSLLVPTSTSQQRSPRKPSHLASSSSLSLPMNELNFPALALVRDPSLRFSTTSTNENDPNNPFNSPSAQNQNPFNSPPPSTITAKKHKSWMPMVKGEGEELSPDERLRRHATKGGKVGGGKKEGGGVGWRWGRKKRGEENDKGGQEDEKN